MRDFKMPKMPGVFGRDRDPKNPTITGADRIAGGTFDSLTISGSGEVDGDVEAKEIGISGSAKISGNVKAGEMKSSGSLGVSGSVEAREISSSGSTGISGDLKAGTVQWSGSGSVGGSVKADSFVAHGAFRVVDKLDAKDIDVELNGDSSAGSITGTNISVKRGRGQSGRGQSSHGGRGGNATSNFSVGSINVDIKSGGSSFTFVSQQGGGGEASDSRLKADSIRGETIELENTDAKSVQGKDVTIGEGSVIGEVRYSGNLTVHEKATVKTKMKI